MVTARSCPSASRGEGRRGASRGRRALALVLLACGLAGCARPLPPPAEDPRVPQLQGEVDALREELRRLSAENAELRGVIDELKALELDRELRRRQVR